ncbi:MAG: flagellar basal body rod protein FlgB [Candidatus Eisenbacteria bacterium]
MAFPIRGNGEAEMLREILFGGRSYGLLRRGLDAGAARMKTVAENIAHVETPGYRAQRVEFEELLGQAQQASIAPTRTHPGHVSGLQGAPSGGTPETSSIPSHQVVTSAEPAAEGAATNVDLESELVEMQKNEIHFEALSQVLAGRYRSLKEIIRP